MSSPDEPIAWQRQHTDPFEYARQLMEQERKARHGMREVIDTVAQNTANATRDLSRNPADPGWVHSALEDIRGDMSEIRKVVGTLNTKLNAIFVALGMAALGLIGNLLMELYGKATG